MNEAVIDLNLIINSHWKRYLGQPAGARFRQNFEMAMKFHQCAQVASFRCFVSFVFDLANFVLVAVR